MSVKDRQRSKVIVDLADVWTGHWYLTYAHIAPFSHSPLALKADRQYGDKLVLAIDRPTYRTSNRALSSYEMTLFSHHTDANIIDPEVVSNLCSMAAKSFESHCVLFSVYFGQCLELSLSLPFDSLQTRRASSLTPFLDNNTNENDALWRRPNQRTNERMTDRPTDCANGPTKRRTDGRSNQKTNDPQRSAPASDRRRRRRSAPKAPLFARGCLGRSTDFKAKRD